MGDTDKLADEVADRLETSEVLADAVAAKVSGHLHEIRGQLLELSYQTKALVERQDRVEATLRCAAERLGNVEERLEGVELAVARGVTPENGEL